MKTPTHIKDLKADPENARVHTPRNIGTIVDAMHHVGAGRSIVIDEHNVIRAGHGTVEAAAEAGITDLIVIDAEPDTLIAHRRSNLDGEALRRLALVDNRAGELSFWDPGKLAAAAQAIDLTGLWEPEALAAALETTLEPILKREKTPAGSAIFLKWGSAKIPLTEEQAKRLEDEAVSWALTHGSVDGFGSVIVRRIEAALHGREDR